MYAKMQVGEALADRVMLRRAAVQIIGDRSVIDLSDSTLSGHLIEREFTLRAGARERLTPVSE